MPVCRSFLCNLFGSLLFAFNLDFLNVFHGFRSFLVHSMLFGHSLLVSSLNRLFLVVGMSLFEGLLDSMSNLSGSLDKLFVSSHDVMEF